MAGRRSNRTGIGTVLAVIACGGILGSLARHALQQAWPHEPERFPWATFGVNVSGCLLIGVLMALVSLVWPGRRLLRPFLGVGVLGGYTTFSAYAVDIQQALSADAPAVAMLYLAATLLGALLAVWAGVIGTTLVVRRRRRTGFAPGGSL
jgi:CrcB protein